MRNRAAKSAWVLGAAALLLGAATTGVIAWPVAVGALHMGWMKPVVASQGSRAFRVAGETEVYRAMTYKGVLSDKYELVKQHPRDSRLPMGEPTVLPRWVASPASAPPDLRESVNSAVTWATGWPWRCAAGEVWHVWTHTPGSGRLATAEEILRPPKTGITVIPARRHLWQIATNATGPTEVPLRIVWRGLIGNVLVWSLSWGALIWGIVFLRRVRRRVKGQCAACGYDLRGAAVGSVCPECGGRSPERAA